jgi:plastocyanin domain-containing protein
VKSKVFLPIIVVLITTFGAASFIQAQKPTSKTQSVRIELTRSGYQPSTFRLRRGIPARVTFVRRTEDDCGREVVFPAFGIRRELPLNQPVLIRFTPRKTGTFSFACGMNMLYGKLIVR